MKHLILIKTVRSKMLFTTGTIDSILDNKLEGYITSSFPFSKQFPLPGSVLPFKVAHKFKDLVGVAEDIVFRAGVL